MSLLSVVCLSYTLPQRLAPPHAGARRLLSPHWCTRGVRACAIVEPSLETSGEDEDGADSVRSSSGDWAAMALRERYPVLRDLTKSIRARRTVEEAELAIKLEDEYRADPSLFEDIDFVALEQRLEQDVQLDALREWTSAGILSEQQLDDLCERQVPAERRDAAFARATPANGSVDHSCGTPYAHGSGGTPRGRR